MPERAPADLELSRRFARLMDDAVRIPGTGFGIGLDAVIGLVPGVGDLLGSSLSGAIVFDAVRRRTPIPVLARMGANLVLDALLGLVPGVGDLLDVAHRANRKNLRLLESSVAERSDRGPLTPGYLLAALGVAVLPFLIGIAISVLALVVLWRLISSSLG